MQFIIVYIFIILIRTVYTPIYTFNCAETQLDKKALFIIQKHRVCVLMINTFFIILKYTYTYHFTTPARKYNWLNDIK